MFFSFFSRFFFFFNILFYLVGCSVRRTDCRIDYPKVRAPGEKRLASCTRYRTLSWNNIVLVFSVPVKGVLEKESLVTSTKECVPACLLSLNGSISRVFTTAGITGQNLRAPTHSHSVKNKALCFVFFFIYILCFVLFCSWVFLLTTKTNKTAHSLPFLLPSLSHYHSLTAADTASDATERTLYTHCQSVVSGTLIVQRWTVIASIESF